MLESWKDRKAKAVPAMLLFCAKMHIQLYRNLKFYKSVYGDGLLVPLNLYAFIWILHCIRFHAGQAHRAPTGINLQNAPLWQCARCAPRKLGPESKGESSFSFFLPCRVPCVQFLLSFVVRHHLHSPGGKLEGSGSKKRGDKLRSFTSPG